VDELQRRRRHTGRGVRDRRYHVAAKHYLAGIATWLAGRVEPRHNVIEELRLGAEVVAKPETLERRAVDEDDLRLDVHLRLTQVEALGVQLEVVEIRRNVGDAHAGGQRVRRHGAPRG